MFMLFFNRAFFCLINYLFKLFTFKMLSPFIFFVINLYIILDYVANSNLNDQKYFLNSNLRQQVYIKLGIWRKPISLWYHHLYTQRKKFVKLHFMQWFKCTYSHNWINYLRWYFSFFSKYHLNGTIFFHLKIHFLDN